MEETGACAIVRTLLAGGVSVCFANPGTTEMVLVEAFDEVPGMRTVLCMHETVCAGAADGYARMTRGKPACTLLHLGVGLANASANLHNAKRASSPVVNIVGDMATWHLATDPLLASDIAGLSKWSAEFTRSCGASPAALAGDVAAALLAIRDFRAGCSRVATLVVPHDAQREKCAVCREPPEALNLLKEDDDEKSLFERSIEVHNASYDGQDAIPKKMRSIAACLSDKAAILVGGLGCVDEASLSALSAIQAKTGCALLVENAFARVDRGVGRPDFVRLPYFPADAKTFLAKFTTVVLCGAREPVAMFGYTDGVSKLLDQVMEIEASDVTGALIYLAKLVGTAAQNPASPKKQKEVTGRLNAHKLCQVLCAVQPADAIIVDESLTSGGSYWDLSQDCPPFSHLTLTGGSIGIGLPLAVGCAVACPGRRVISFQADGSGLYSTPALWTQAAEGLDVTTIICANGLYQILKVEQQKQKLKTAAPNAKKLTALQKPSVDWVSLAKGYGVEACLVSTAEELRAALLVSFQRTGPYLIQAQL